MLWRWVGVVVGWIRFVVMVGKGCCGGWIWVDVDVGRVVVWDG